MNVNRKKNKDWLELVQSNVETFGFCILEDVLDHKFLDETRKAMYSTQEKILKSIGQEKLDRAGELGVLRLMMKYEPFFFKFLEIPELTEIVDRILSPTAIMHLQNGFILPPNTKKAAGSIFQLNFHRDFRPILNGAMCSLNLFFAIDEFTKDNGATLVVPKSHRKEPAPTQEEIEKNVIAATCSAGSVVIFDSTLIHAGGINTSGRDRLAINHQFTHSYFKQQLDYPRALGNQCLELKPRTQQLLGWYTRVPSSLEEYYVPADQRLYRAGQL